MSTEIQEREAERGLAPLSLVQRAGGRKFLIVMSVVLSAILLAGFWGPDGVGSIKDLVLALLAAVGPYLGVNAATNGINGGKK